MTGNVRRGFLWVLKNTLNRATLRAARSGRGPFSLVRHVGRKTGTVYETPLILATVPEGFIAELTYGPAVAWYRNIEAAGQCVVVVRGVEHHIDRIEPCTPQDGLRAFGNPAALVLKLLRRREYRFLHEAGPPPAVDQHDKEGGMARADPISRKDASLATRVAFRGE